MSLNGEVSHVCLVGPLVTDDWDLIRKLRSQHLVTLIESIEFLSEIDRLSQVRLMVMDCSQDGDAALEGLPELKQEFSDLCILLVDGELSQKQIAKAFQDGVKDYFAAPYEVDLLAERIDYLCGTRSSGDWQPNTHDN